MESHDLDVDNYDLEDLLELFKLDYNFSGDDLKKAKTICLQTHPDKSGLEPKYFFFLKNKKSKIHLKKNLMLKKKHLKIHDN